MIRLFVALPVVVALAQGVSAAPIPADEKYEIKLSYVPKVGEVSLEKSYTKVITHFKFTDAQGKPVGEVKETETKLLEYEQTILKVENKQVIKFTNKYTRADIENTRGKREASYLKRTVTFERKDGKFVITADDGPELTGEDLAGLQGDVDDAGGDKFDRAMEPGKTIKVGETWTPDAKKIAEAFNEGDELKIGDTGKVTAKLLKAYKKDKEQWGILEATLELPIKSALGVEILPGSTYSLKCTIDTAIDGSAAVGSFKRSGTAKVKYKADMGDQKVNVEGETKFEEEQSSTVKPTK